MLLCDYAAVSEGKLYISGGGWVATGPQPSTSAVAVQLEIPWDRTNTPLRVKLRLLAEDGEPATQIGPAGPVAIEIEMQLEVGRPPGMKSGTPISAPFALNFPPFPLTPGRRYSWELSVNGDTEADWHLSFDVRPAPAPATDPTALPPI